MTIEEFAIEQINTLISEYDKIEVEMMITDYIVLVRSSLLLLMGKGNSVLS